MTSSTTSAKMLVFEDFQPGLFGTFGPRFVTRQEILDFAAEYDPQPMHLDEAAAKASLLGGLAGSGWHMCALLSRLIVDGVLLRARALGGLGIDETKWLAPLRPDTSVEAVVHVLESRPSRSRPEVGIVRFRFDLRELGGKILMTQTPSVIVRRRDTGAQQAQ